MANDPQPTPIIVHRVGTPAAPHFETVRAFRDYLTAVLEAHIPTSERPDAVIEFPGGFWVNLTTATNVEAPRP